MNPYIGHESQLNGVEEHRLVGGRGDGMRLYEINNGKGLELTVVPDRNGDISRLRYRGINLSYLSPCGYVAPAYYDGFQDHWLRSFTAGFLTTCGLESVGTPCVDEGETLPLHGSIANQPAEYCGWSRGENALVIKTLTRDEWLFGRKLTLLRKLIVSTEENRFEIRDTIENTGDRIEPLEILYHMNIGYPLLSEHSILDIPSKEVIPRNEHAAADLENWMKIHPPVAGYEEKCYYHRFPDQFGKASVFQPTLGVELEISFDASLLDGFVEWKMLGVRDYVLGLECGNCYPDGRDIMRKTGMLKFIKPGQKIQYHIFVRIRNKR